MLESVFINTGLLALGNVISALGDPKRKVITGPTCKLNFVDYDCCLHTGKPRTLQRLKNNTNFESRFIVHFKKRMMRYFYCV